MIQVTENQLQSMFHRFTTFNQVATPYLFTEIFGVFPSEHLWDKYLQLNRNTMAWYCYLDIENANKLILYLKTKTDE